MIATFAGTVAKQAEEIESHERRLGRLEHLSDELRVSPAEAGSGLGKAVSGTAEAVPWYKPQVSSCEVN